MSEQDRDKAIRKSVVDRVLKRAATDIDFRRLLVDNPKSAIARELGIDVPDTVHVTVLPETQNHFFIVIPPISKEEVDDNTNTGIERLTAGGVVGYNA